MHVIGVDLAWAQRNPTGVAVLDEPGRLRHVSSLRTDDEIVDVLAPFTRGSCLVAIDAPLIVTNPTGNRAAEKALNQDFARFDAGAHPANTGKPEFAGGPRGGHLADRLGLDRDPHSWRRRRAIEVYPHPASIALFRLGRTLKYKNKPGRDLELLRGQLLTLMDLIQGLDAATPRLSVGDDAWPGLRKAVLDATRKSQLRVVEDQVDAVLCAYVGLLHHHAPERITIYGSAEAGCILTPALPADLVPAPRPVAAAPDTASGGGGDTDSGGEREAGRAAVRQYAEKLSETEDAATRFVDVVTAVLDEAGINYLSVTGRAKSVTSFAAKASRQQDGQPLYPDPLHDITDQVGVRVITYVLDDVAAVAELLRDQLQVTDDRDLGRETANQGRFGYASRHLLIGLGPDHPASGQLGDRMAAVQIRTVLQHAWAEFEHEIRYKGSIPDEHGAEFDRRFTLAAGLLELADREFSAIRDRLQPGPAEVDPSDDPRIAPRELAAFLAGQYADAGWSRTDHYAWISDLLLELGITSLVELGELLRPLEELRLSERMGYRYPPGAVRRLDDALLAAFGERYVLLHGNSHRVPALRTRLDRLPAPARPGSG